MTFVLAFACGSASAVVWTRWQQSCQHRRPTSAAVWEVATIVSGWPATYYVSQLRLEAVAFVVGAAIGTWWAVKNS